MNKKVIIIISIAVVALVGGFILFNANSNNSNKIEILDATYSCNDTLEEFYRDDNYIYYFPCVKSSSVFVLYSNGNKELVVYALENKNVTIEELDKAGLVYTKSER